MNISDLYRNVVARGLALALTGGIAWAAIPSGAYAEDAYIAGVDAYRHGEYGAALSILRPLAEKGDAQAQYWLAQMYQNGFGVPEDMTAAADWYRKAAAQNLQSAQKQLADQYYLGKGVEKDYAAAAELYLKAAKSGHPEAQFMIGHMYHYGYGVPKDKDAAVMWYRTAADQGYQIGEVLRGLE